jgi:hypothetical protein
MLAFELDPRAALAQPYPGLRSFEPAESFLFFGRQLQTKELLRRLSSARLLAVVGTSGSGKSSLVRAGLLPALYRGHLVGAGSAWRIAVMRPGGGPLNKLADGLVAAGLYGPDECQAIRTRLGRTSIGLLDVVRRSPTYGRENLLLVVDQFEELFRFRTDREQQDGGAEAALFVASVLEAVDQLEVPIYVVLTMRSDFLGDCAEFVGLPEALNRSQYLVPRLTREDRQEAIVGPARVAGTRITARLVQRVLNDAGDDPDQLPVLQQALMATFREWKQEGSNGEIDLRHFERAGTMADAINRDAQSVYDRLDASDRAVARKLFQCLTTVEGGRTVRRPARIDRILSVIGAPQPSASAAQIERIIRQFAASPHSFLVVPSSAPLTGDCVIDISHESLIRKWTALQGWVKHEADSVDWYRSLVQDSELYPSGAVGLWRDPDLKQALRRKKDDEWNQAWADQYAPGFPAVVAFLARSQASQRRRRVLLIAAVAAVVLAVGTGYGMYRRAIYVDHLTELQLREQLAKTAFDQADATQRLEKLQMELGQTSDPRRRDDLERQLAGTNAQLQNLRNESLNANKKLEGHKSDRASQDPLLKSAYAQIDSLQSQLSALRAQGRCIKGFVPREAIPGDNVCVTPAVHSKVKFDNSQAEVRKAGGGPYGPDTCLQGYVWRDAIPGDHVCVEPDVRTQAAEDNRQAQNRVAVLP